VEWKPLLGVQAKDKGDFGLGTYEVRNWSKESR